MRVDFYCQNTVETSSAFNLPVHLVRGSGKEVLGVEHRKCGPESPDNILGVAATAVFTSDRSTDRSMAVTFMWFYTGMKMIHKMYLIEVNFDEKSNNLN